MKRSELGSIWEPRDKAKRKREQRENLKEVGEIIKITAEISEIESWNSKIKTTVFLEIW